MGPKLPTRLIPKYHADFGASFPYHLIKVKSLQEMSYFTEENKKHANISAKELLKLEFAEGLVESRVSSGL